MKNELKQLWHLAFGDGEEFIDLFFRTAYDPEKCLYMEENGRITAALYWLDCEFQGQKQAYIYAVATHPEHWGKGLCRCLMDRTHAVLKQQGYTAALLRPADEGLRRMYRKMGYRTATCVTEFTCTAGEALPLQKIGPEDYARLRRKFLPEGGVIQEGVSIAYLQTYAELYAGADFVLAGIPSQEEFLGIELLGSPDAAPGILAALNCKTGSFRCPGGQLPFGMFLPLTDDAAEPSYLGLVFD